MNGVVVIQRGLSIAGLIIVGVVAVTEPHTRGGLEEDHVRHRIPCVGIEIQGVIRIGAEGSMFLQEA